MKLTNCCIPEEHHVFINMKLLISGGKEPYLSPELAEVIRNLEVEEDLEKLCFLLNEFDCEDVQVNFKIHFSLFFVWFYVLNYVLFYVCVM